MLFFTLEANFGTIKKYPMKLRYLVLASLVVGLAFSILFVSLSRASLVGVRQKLGSIVYHNILITLANNTITDSDQEMSTKTVDYNLPPVTMLPTSPFYGFKRVRDYLWLKFTFDPVIKGKLELLMADKKVSEAVKMAPDTNESQVYDAFDEGIGYLQAGYADLAASKENIHTANQLMVQARKSGEAFKMILGNIGKLSEESDVSKKQELLDKLANWNEKVKVEEEN